MLDTPINNFITTVTVGNGNLDDLNNTISKSPPPANKNITFTLSTAGARDTWLNPSSDFPTPAIYGYGPEYVDNPFNASEYIHFNTSGVYTTACINTITSAVFELHYNDPDSFYSDETLSLSDYGTPVWNYPDSSCDNWFHLQNGFVPNPDISFSAELNSTVQYAPQQLAYTPAWNVSYLFDSNNYECVSGSKLNYQWVNTSTLFISSAPDFQN